MVVKDVICEVLWMAGRSDVSDDISEGAPLSDEQWRMQRACLTYLNAVIDELARGYFPLEYEEEMTSPGGRFAFADFSKRPLEIKRVTVNSKPVNWHVAPDYLVADGKTVSVLYSYAPAPLTIDDEFVYPAFAVSERLIEYGMLAEYYLVLGDAASSEVWENKYREEIENLLSRSKVRGRIPPRRWI